MSMDAPRNNWRSVKQRSVTHNSRSASSTARLQLSQLRASIGAVATEAVSEAGAVTRRHVQETREKQQILASSVISTELGVAAVSLCCVQSATSVSPGSQGSQCTDDSPSFRTGANPLFGAHSNVSTQTAW